MMLQKLQSLLNSATQFIQKQELEKAFNLLQEGNRMLKNISPIEIAHKKLQIDYYYQMEVIYDAKTNYNAGIKLALERLKLNKEVFGQESEQNLDNFNDLMYYFNIEGKYQEALKYSNLFLQYATSNISSGLRIQHLLNRATIFRNIGDFDYALSLHHKIEAELQDSPKNLELRKVQHNNHALCLSEKGDKEEALIIYKKLLVLMEENHPHIADVYNNMAACYTDLQNYEESIKCYQKALIISKKYSYLSAITLHIYTNIGRSYFGLKDLKNAFYYTQKAQDFSKNQKLQDPKNKIVLQMNLSRYYLESQEYEAALRALEEVHPSDSREDIQSIKSQYLPTYVLDLFFQKSKVYQYSSLQESLQKKEVLELLRNALQAIEVAIEVLSELHKSYKVKGSKLILSANFKKLYEQALKVTSALSEHPLLSQTEKEEMKQQAFTYFEQSKAILLYTQLNENTAKTMGHIPKVLLQQEKDLQMELTYLEKNIQKAKIQERGGDSEKNISMLQNQFFDLLQEYHQLIEKLEKNYPKYHRLKHNLKTIELKNLQNQLEEKTAMINYFVGDKFLFISLLSSQKLQVRKFEKTSNLELLVQKFKRCLTTSPLDKKRYIRDAYQLYKYLILPIEEYLKGIEKLIIIPDEILNYLPFEALLVESIALSVHFKNLPYLLQSYTISYHYSATLYNHSAKRKKKDSKESYSNHFLGVAPVYIEKGGETLKGNYDEQTMRDVQIGNTVYPTLLESEKEVQNVVNQFEKLQFSTQALLHQRATIEVFRKLAKSCQYILIAAHGHYNDEYPELSGIIFSPNSTEIGIENKESKDSKDTLFYTADAYHLSLQADLVVLSCCESGIGKLAKGEGMMAINRGFLYAGAKNVIYTLFKIYDKQSNELTQTLFKYILEGQPYGEALRNAKLMMIQERGYEPVYWAGYVLLGE